MLAAFASWAMLVKNAAFSGLVDFDGFYIVVILLQSMFGVFVLPFSMNLFKAERELFVDYLVLFLTTGPFVVVGAFATSVPWYRVCLTQMVIFSIWTVAYGTRKLLEYRWNAGMLYVPLWILFFFGFPVAGEMVASFVDNAKSFSSFSFAGVLFSWSRGSYLEPNGWLGVFSCLGAVVIWSVKIMQAEKFPEISKVGKP